MVAFLLECKEDEEKQVIFSSKEASHFVFEMTASLPMVPYLMMSNNINIVFL